MTVYTIRNPESTLAVVFPGIGKTSSNFGVDLDYGKIRKAFRLSFESEQHRGTNAIGLFYHQMLELLSYKHIPIVWVNEPRLKWDSLKQLYDHVYFVVPDFSAREWLNRISKRGDDLSEAWIQEVYNNYDQFIEDWINIAHDYRISVFRSHDLSADFAAEKQRWINAGYPVVFDELWDTQRPMQPLVD